MQLATRSSTSATNSQAKRADDGRRRTLDELDEAKRSRRDQQLQASGSGRASWAGSGKAIEPVVRPLGWDWQIGMAALASFPAREVVVGTLGIIYNQGEGDAGRRRGSRRAAGRDAARGDAGTTSRTQPVFTVPVALSLMVFFALCCQCASTLAVIRARRNSWRWPVFTFVYMTVLAYVGALVVYQIGSSVGS